MLLQDLPIRRKLMTIILLISGVVSLLTCASFFAYEYLTFRQSLVADYTIRSQIIAANSTAALAFDNHEDAAEVLSALKADPHLEAAGLYDRQGKLFARYPADLPDGALPARPGELGYRFEGDHLVAFQPVAQGGRRLGTVYLQSDLTAMAERFRLYALIVALVMLVSFTVAYLLSRVLQSQISRPILALAEAARVVSDRRDYSVRAAKLGEDELGRLTDDFNSMLEEIQKLHQNLERRVVERTAQLEVANAEFKSLFESIDEGYCIIQMLFDERDRPVDYRFLTINPAFAKQTGLTHAQGRRMLELAPAHEAHWFETYGRIALTGEPERFQNHAAQLHRWFDVYAFRYGDPKNRQVAILFNNITERKLRELEIEKLNAELLQRAAQLEAANKELEAFSYSVSHDLRAPLRHIDGFAGLLLKSDGPAVSERGRGYLAHIAGSAKQMGLLIDDLLVFSRMARTEMNVGPVDLQKMTEETIHALRAETAQRNIRWTRGDLPVVPGDPAMLRQVFVNLLANAVKYTGPRDPAEIEIGCRDEGNGEVVVFVRDNGVGFEMEYAHKLFGVFQRLHRAEDFEGTGIGLANVRRIVTRHGGRTWGEGRAGAGATFYFTLPTQAKGPS